MNTTLELLLRYGRHDNSCPLVNGVLIEADPNLCKCGLSQAIVDMVQPEITAKNAARRAMAELISLKRKGTAGS